MFIKRIFAFAIAYTCISMSIAAQLNLDSLWSIWNNNGQVDTVRFQSLFKITKDRSIRNNPDTSYILSQLYYDSAKDKGLKQEMADGLHMLGNSFRVRSLYKTSLAYYDSSLSIRNEIGDHSKKFSYTLNNIGGVYKQLGSYDSALNYYQRSADVAIKINNDEILATVYNNIGNIHSALGNLSLAIDFYKKSLEIEEEMDNKPRIAMIFNNIGILYGKLNIPSNAIEYHTKSLKMKEEINDQRGISTSLLNLGFLTVENTNNYEDALKQFTRCLEIRKKFGDTKGISYALQGLGYLYSKLGKSKMAIDYYNKSIALHEEIGHKLGIANSLNNLAIENTILGDYKQAIKNNERSLEIAQEIRALEAITVSAQTLSENYTKTQQHRAALEMYKLFIQSRDSILSQTNKVKIVQYEYEKQIHADSIKKAEAFRVQEILVKNQIEKNKRQQQQTYFLYGGITLLVILLILLQNRFRIADERKRIIEEQKICVDQKNKALLEKNEKILAQSNEIKFINKYLAKRVKKRTEELELQNKKLKEYAFSNSHEVRAPLSRLLGLIGLWNSDNITNPERNFLIENISTSVKELDNIVKKLSIVLEKEDFKSY